MQRPRKGYHSYLLRIWHSTGSRRLHIRLEEIGTDHNRNFADLDALHRYLRAQMDDEDKPPSSGEHGR
ncbi:MAG: hypothetical protein HY328_06070 [Chloroflexi bacterium]|nr:hypothetical protein [Chloroflexota bacterium]